MTGAIRERPISAAALAVSVISAGAPIAARTEDSRALRPASAFSAIADRHARSLALFAEVGRVIESPRCLNCHPRGDRPNQGEDGHPHQPLVLRGARNYGIVGLHCSTCHQANNITLNGATLRSIPGHPEWRLAPREMAWEGRTLGALCAQIRDPARNGGRSLARLADHMAGDTLVGWAWHPGSGRRPAPGTQREFGGLIQAWIATGAACPAP